MTTEVEIEVEAPANQGIPRTDSQHQEPGRGRTLPEHLQRQCGPANTLISDILPPELGDRTLRLFKAPSLWYFVTAAPGREYSCVGSLA